MAIQSQSPRSGARPGAMTAAMQAAGTRTGPRVLRIGVIQHGAIVEERVMRTRGAVSIGTTESSTFTLKGDGIPARFEVFGAATDGYVLRFTAAMDGRVGSAAGVRTLRDLAASGAATRVGDAWELALDDSSRGKVTLGDVALLFQFVAPLPLQPRPQLPTAIRGGLGRNMDWAYNACLSGFLALAIGGLGYIEYGYDPQVEDNFTLDVRLVQIAMPVLAIEPPPPALPPAATPPDLVASRAPAPAAPNHAPDPHVANNAAGAQHPTAPRAPRPDASAMADLSATRAADAAEHAMTGGPRFDALTGLLDQHRGTARDMLASGSPMGDTLAAMGRTGVTTEVHEGVSRPSLSARAGGPSGDIGHGSRVDSGGPGITSGNPVARERPLGHTVVEPAAPHDTGGTGVCSMAAIAATMRREVGGIRACYDVAVRRNPQLSGRMELSFTIGASGRVVGQPEASGMSQDPLFVQCVENRVRYVTFPQSEGGTCEVEFPFRFDHPE